MGSGPSVMFLSGVPAVPDDIARLCMRRGCRRDRGGTVCSIAGLEDGVLVVAEVGANRRSLLRYDDLLALEGVGHGQVNTGLRYAGGGRGVRGALTGMVVASMLTNTSRTVAADSFIRITSRQAEMVLSHSRYSPDRGSEHALDDVRPLPVHNGGPGRDSGARAAPAPSTRPG